MRANLLVPVLAGLLLVCLLNQGGGQERPDLRVEFSSSITELEANYPSVEGVWTLNLNGSMATMALRQSGEWVWGQVRGEGGRWDGPVAGSAKDHEMVLSLAYQTNGSTVSALLRGTLKDDSLGGIFVRSDGQIEERGPFVSRRMSNSTEGYPWGGGPDQDGATRVPGTVNLSRLWRSQGIPVMSSIKQGLVPAEAGPI